MLDTYARKIVDPWIDGVARVLRRARLTPNGVTALAMVVGGAAGFGAACGWTGTAIALLWISGLLDAADGALARMTRSSSLGAILDITADRVVEISVIVGLAWRHPEASWDLVILAGVIAIAMSLFLSIAAALRNRSMKSFHYAPGLGERTEAFLCLSAMMAGSAHLRPWTWLFIAVIVFTMGQRLRQVTLALRTDAA